ncbi:MAG: hypothetical protein KC766_22200 [Myxococcales bacterium]|nr:hypothetical protein [Myxococcales bacterium]
MRHASISHIAVALFVSLSFVACEKKNDSPQQVQQPTTPAAPAAASAAEPTHAAQGVRAGSHEDWCGEHQVPESLCTRCNPSLIAAFKATGDWCEEHGLPESQCLICNPDLKIERPPRTGETSP